MLLYKYMAERVLLSQPFVDRRSSFTNILGEARRDFYMESVGFGTVKLMRPPGHDDTSVYVDFTDIEVVCGVPLIRYPGATVGKILLNDSVIEYIVHRSAAERDETEIPIG